MSEMDPNAGGGFLGKLSGLFPGISSVAANIRQKSEDRKRQRVPYTADPEEMYVMNLLQEVKRVRQHLRYLPTSRQFEPKKEEDWLPYPTVNMIQSKVQRATDFFTRNRPVGYCVADGDHEDNRRAAKHGDNILRYISEDQDDEEKLDEAATWMLITGNTFWKTIADSHTPAPNPTVAVSKEPLLGPDGEPILDDQQMPVMTDRYGEGGNGDMMQQPQGVQIKSDVYGPLHMTVPLASPRANDAPWMCEISLQSMEGLRLMYPDKAQHIGTRGRAVTSDLYMHRILTLLTSGVNGLIRAVDPYSLEGYGIVYHYEQAPTREFPNGIMLVALDDIPLVIGELPLGHKYSWEHMGYHRVPGRFWCRGMVEDCLDPQDQINKIEQFLRVNDDHNANPLWLKPINAEIPEGLLKNKPGIVIPYKWPFKPEVVQGVSMPAQMIQRRAMYMEDIDEVTNVRNVLMGNAPAGVRAGVALNRLREEAEGGFEPIAKRFDRFIERIAESKLEAVARYWTEPQHFTLEGDDGTIMEVRDFVGGMLRNVRKWKIEAGSWRPSSKSGQQQMALDLFKSGLLPMLMLDPEQHRMFMELMQLEGFEAEQSADYKRAKLENEQLLRSVGWEQVHREPGDDDLVHLATHAKERKKPEWAKVPNVVKLRYFKHEVEHIEAVMEAGGIPDLSLNQSDPEAVEGSDDQAPTGPGAPGQPSGGATPGGSEDEEPNP
jgi:hypothetical protein